MKTQLLKNKSFLKPKRNSDGSFKIDSENAMAFASILERIGKCAGIITVDYLIEFYGDYWHANPKIYKPDDIIHHKFKAKDIWENDKQRIKILEELGYFVHIVWQSDVFFKCLK